MVKKLFFVGIFLFKCLYLISQLNQITFQVDLNNEVISPHGVHIAGDFQSVAGLGGNWSPSSTEMMDNNGDGIYSITLLLLMYLFMEKVGKNMFSFLLLLFAIIDAASRAAFIAPSSPIANVPTGIPLGI